MDLASEADRATRVEDLRANPILLKTDSWDVQYWAYRGRPCSAFEISTEGDFAPTVNRPTFRRVDRGLPGKSLTAVPPALNQIQPGWPFRLLGVDSDNGSELIRATRKNATGLGSPESRTAVEAINRPGGKNCGHG
jgi:hypothetical protein